MFLVGSVESHTILYDSTQSYVRSYHFYDPSAILIVLVRCDRKIVRSYDPHFLSCVAMHISFLIVTMHTSFLVLLFPLRYALPLFGMKS